MAFVPVLWNRQNEFDDFFSDIDPFGGWGFGRPMVVARRRHQQEKPRGPQKWTYSVKIGDFDPQHVKVKVENGKVIISAKYSDGNDEWGDSVEKRRTVALPENVDPDKVHSYMRSDGSLMLEAPYKQSGEKQIAVVPCESGYVMPSDNESNLMKFDVGRYNPEEVKVSCKDGILTAQGERQRSEDGHEVREFFCRQMTVPSYIDGKNIQCFRDTDGNLTIRAPKMEDVDMEKKD